MRVWRINIRVSLFEILSFPIMGIVNGEGKGVKIKKSRLMGFKGQRLLVQSFVFASKALINLRSNCYGISYYLTGLMRQWSINKQFSFDNLLVIPSISVLTRIYDSSQFLLKCSVYLLFRDICNPNCIVRMVRAVYH